MPPQAPLTQDELALWTRDGFALAPSLFSAEEVAAYREHYMRMREAGAYPGDDPGVDIGPDDPLKRYPRLTHPHRWDDVSLKWLTDPRIAACLTQLAGRSPYGVQTMVFFKPPGGRGQALHQDQFYLRADPGTCYAAWLALDDCDEENGCLIVVPGTHGLPMLCPEEADVTASYSPVTVAMPPEMPPVSVCMKAGDVLFFNGSLVHGSGMNRSADRFRRSLVGHYIGGEANAVARYYHPVYAMDGTVVELGVSEGGGPCGVWSGQPGARRVEYEAAGSSAPDGPHG